MITDLRKSFVSRCSMTITGREPVERGVGPVERTGREEPVGECAWMLWKGKDLNLQRESWVRLP